MKFETSRSFSQPKAAVLAKLSDPAHIIGLLQGHGVDVQAGAQNGPMQASVNWRGAARRFSLTPPRVQGDTVRMTVLAVPATAEITVTVADAPGGCVATAVSDVAGHSAKAKLALQSARLIKGKAQKRFGNLLASLVGN